MPHPKSIRGFAREKLGREITAIHDALIVKAEVKKIPEGTFVKEILPAITGESVNSDFPLLMAAVAGSPFAEADIIDQQGNVLFRMPALLERDIISHDEASKRGSLGSMMITAGMLSHQSPRRAEIYLQHEFDGRGIAKNRDEIIKRRQERWNEILGRYGYALKEDGTVVPTGKTAAGKSSSSEARPELEFGNDELL